MTINLDEILVLAGQSAPSADNSQPWQMCVKKSIFSVMYDAQRVSKKTFRADAPATYLAIGALLENLNQICKEIHCSPKWRFPDTLNLEQPVYFEAILDNVDTSFELKKLDEHPVFKRHTNRYSFDSTQLPSHVIDSMQTTGIDDARVLVITDTDKIVKVAKLVELASRIRFRTQEIHEWLGKSFRFGKEAKQSCDGLDVATLDLPPGGSLFLRFVRDWQRMKIMNYFGTFKLMALIDSVPIKKAPALIAIIGQSGFHETLSAGQLMERIWIDLNEQEIGVHPYYVVSDQINRLKENKIPLDLISQAEKVNQSTTALFNLKEEETLHMLLRVGYPKVKVKRSYRLPIDKIYSAES